MGPTARRSFAAVLAADIAGYSRLMHADEAGTLADLDDFRQDHLFPKVSRFHGDIVKSMGDGWFVVFDSVSEAVNCAVALQTGLLGHPRIAIRIGIHAGEIVRSDDDLFGDGVNVAARLEALALPGAVLMSEAALHSLTDGPAVSFQRLGSRQLKNIETPVLLYGWAPGEIATSPLAQAEDHAPVDPSTQPSVNIAPFALTGDRDTAEDLAGDFRYELTHMLSRRTGLRVLSDRDAATLADYRMDGRCRVRSGRSRLDIILSAAPQGAQLWTGRFDAPVDDADAMTVQIARHVSALFRHISTHRAGAHLAKRSDESLSVSELLAKAAHLVQQYDADGTLRALRTVQQALLREPENPMANAMLAGNAFMTRYVGVPLPPNLHRKQILAVADHALRLDPGSDFAHVARGQARLCFAGDAAGARSDILHALDLNPDYIHGLLSLGNLDMFTGRCDEALATYETILPALNGDPIQPLCRALVALCHFLQGNHGAAQRVARDAIDRGPTAMLCGLIYVASGASAADGGTAGQTVMDRLGLHLGMVTRLPFTVLSERDRLYRAAAGAGLQPEKAVRTKTPTG